MNAKNHHSMLIAGMSLAALIAIVFSSVLS
jgi:hypothetical protein